jgi:hypothetical protein
MSMIISNTRKRTSALPPGRSPATLLRLAGSISKKDLQKIKTAIKEACERVGPDEWQPDQSIDQRFA